MEEKKGKQNGKDYQLGLLVKNLKKKKRCERKLTQGDKNEGRSNYIWGKKKNIYIYILIIKDTKNSGRE